MENIGERLRIVRTKNNLSQRQLAKKAGVTNGLISLIEQNRVSPSIASLKKVLEGIPISLAEFFTAEISDQHKTFYSADELPDLGKENISYRLIGYDRHGRAMSILHETYQPATDTGEDMLTHDGEEGGVVVCGEIELTVGNDVRVLKAGDSYYFESKIPHRFRNIGKEVCELISANTPPTF